MGNYDNILSPVSGQPVSKSQFGDPVIAAINDLDSRMTAFDGSSQARVALATSNLVIAVTSDTVALTITGFTFRTGFAYKATFKSGFFTASAGTLAMFRVRKTNAAGIDYGEMFRYRGEGSPVMNAHSHLYMLRTASTDLTTDVVLCASASVAVASSLTLFGSSASPRWFVIEPVGYTTTYASMGVAVT